MTAEHDLSVVRACQVARLSRAAYYKPGVDRMARDAEVITALQAIVVDEQRWGFWKCHDRLRAQGYRWNHKRVWRVYCQLRLNLPRRTRRRVPHRERQPLPLAMWHPAPCPAQQVQPKLAVHPPDALVIPAVALRAQSVATLPEPPALLHGHDSLQSRDNCRVSRCWIDARSVVRRPR